jgi:hypothetical protein
LTSKYERTALEHTLTVRLVRMLDGVFDVTAFTRRAVGVPNLVTFRVEGYRAGHDALHFSPRSSIPLMSFVRVFKSASFVVNFDEMICVAFDTFWKKITPAISIPARASAFVQRESHSEIFVGQLLFLSADVSAWFNGHVCLYHPYSCGKFSLSV